MKKNIPIEELKRGDRIFIDYGGRSRVKVLNNRPELKMIVVSMWYIPFFGLALGGHKETFKYSDSAFKNYTLHNIFN